MATPLRMDIRTEFTACVRALGGLVLDEEDIDRSVPNADFWFPKYQTAVELKCLEQDLGSNTGYQAKMAKLVESWMHRKLVPRRPGGKTLQFDAREIPEVCAPEWITVIAKRLDSSVLRHGDKQLSFTKKSLGGESAKGQLVVAVDGNFTMKPDLFAHLVFHSMQKHGLPGIDGVTYFTENDEVIVPGIDDAARVCFDWVLGTREPAPSAFRSELREGWFSHVAKITHRNMRQVDVPRDNDTMVERIRFRRS